MPGKAGQAGASWIWMGGRRKEINCHLLFRREFTLAGGPTGGRLRIAASDQYRLYVNGRHVGDGPARSEIPTAYVDTYEIGGGQGGGEARKVGVAHSARPSLREDARPGLRLRKGVNCIAVLAHNTMLPQHGQSLVPGGIWVELECTDADGRATRVGSDGAWRVAHAGQFAKPAPRRFFAVGFNESLDFAAEPEGWTRPGFDDRAWEKAEEVDDRFYSRLVERPIPMLRFEEWRPARVRQSGRVAPPAGACGLPFGLVLTSLPAGEAAFGTYIYAEKGGEVAFSFGCDNWARMWVNGGLVWEQGRPDARFRNHLEYDVDKYDGMVAGNGHRFEPGMRWNPSRLSADKSRQVVRLKKGWNEVTVWLCRPRQCYGFELCFIDTRSWQPAATVCSAGKDRTDVNTWALLPDEKAAAEAGKIVNTRGGDLRPLLDASHLWDWDVRTVSSGPHPGAESLLKSDHVLAGRAETALRRMGETPMPREMTLPPHGFIDFALPADGVGSIDVECRGPAGTVLDVSISEAQSPDGRMRSLYNGLWQTDRLLLDGQWNRWLSLDRRAGRYLGLVVRRGGPVEVRKFALYSQHYPVRRAGRFECSDWVFTRMWSAGAATVDAATFDVAEDCPTREKAQWGGDTYLRLFECAYLWGDLRLSAKGLREFAEDQKSDRWSRPMVPSGYGDKLVEYCYLLAPWAWEQYVFTGDVGVLRDTFQGVRNLLAYGGSLVDRRGFSQPGKDPRNLMYIDYTMPPLSRCGDTIGVMQCLYVMALESAARIAALLGESDLASEWSKTARKVRELVRTHFWDEKAGVFADGLRRGKPGGTFSAPTNYWMLLSGIADERQEASILRRLWLSPDKENMEFWSRGESPYTKFFMSEALLARGLWRQAFASWRGYYGTMLRHPEAWSVFECWQRDWVKLPLHPRNSLVHPFGIGPMAHLAKYVAGVRPLRPGYDGLLWQPMPGDLKWMKAEFPLTGRDDVVRVEVETGKGGGRRLVLHRPVGLEVLMSDKYLGPRDRMEVV